MTFFTLFGRTRAVRTLFATLLRPLHSTMLSLGRTLGVLRRNGNATSPDGTDADDLRRRQAEEEKRR